MRLLLDENVQARAATLLAPMGHDCLHVGGLALLGAPDEIILQAAADSDRTLVTADTDFGQLLTLSGARSPSVLLLRNVERAVEQRVHLIHDALTLAEDPLDAGALVVVEPGRLRIRPLPIRPGR